MFQSERFVFSFPPRRSSKCKRGQRTVRKDHKTRQSNKNFRNTKMEATKTWNTTKITRNIMFYPFSIHRFLLRLLSQFMFFFVNWVKVSGGIHQLWWLKRIYVCPKETPPTQPNPTQPQHRVSGSNPPFTPLCKSRSPPRIATSKSTTPRMP